MTTTIGERIEQVRGSRNQAEFARMLGVHKNTLSNYERNKGTPDANFITKLVDMGFSAHWLLTGEGAILYANTTPPSIHDNWLSNIKDPAVGEKPQLEYSYVQKLVDVEVSAGAGSEATDGNGIEELAFKSKWLAMEGLSAKSLRVVTCRGDSMSPTIPENSTLLVDISQNEFAREGIYVIRLDDHLFAKRLQRGQSGAILVISDNALYSPITVLPGQQDLQVVGKVVWLGHTI